MLYDEKNLNIRSMFVHQHPKTMHKYIVIITNWNYRNIHSMNLDKTAKKYLNLPNFYQ